MDATDPAAARQPGDAASADAAGAIASPPTEPAALAGDGLCPFLIGGEGAWRMSIPDRDHRCAAFSPATSLAPSKQARLCLTATHVGCATYIASTSARQAKVGSGAPADRAGRWGIARTTPVVREIGGLRATVGALLADRRTWPAIPAVLLATLALALGLSGTWSEAPLTAVASPTAKARPTAIVRPTPRPSPTPTEPATTAATGSPTPPASPTPGPTTAYTSYKVKSGDTLYVIARRFGTTVKAIQKLNGLTSTILHAGQVLKIPA